MTVQQWRPPSVVESVTGALDEPADRRLQSRSALAGRLADLVLSLRVSSGARVTIGPAAAPALARALAARGSVVTETDGSGQVPLADVVVLVPEVRTITTVTSRDDLRESVDWATRATAPDGALVLLVRNVRPLARLITANARGQQAPWPIVVEDPLADLNETLSSMGMEHQRSMSVFPGIERTAIVAGSAFTDAQASRMVTTFVREPSQGTSDSALLLADPTLAFRMACAQGVGAAVAGSYLIVAARRPDAVMRVAPDAHLWTLGAVRRRPEWREARELVREEGRWSWRPRDRRAEVRSGPFVFRPEPSDVVPGINGGDFFREAVWAGGQSVEVLRAWWDAADTAWRDSSTDGRQFDVHPDNFTVDGDGRWHFIQQGLTLRFPLPPAVLAYRILHQIVTSTGAWVGCLPRLQRDATVHDVVRLMLNDLDVEADDGTILGWVELETDLQVRTMRARVDRVEVRRQLRNSSQARLSSLATSLPLDLRLKAAFWSSSSAAVELAESRRLAELEEQLDSTRSTLRSRTEKCRQLVTRNTELRNRLAGERNTNSRLRAQQADLREANGEG